MVERVQAPGVARAQDLVAGLERHYRGGPGHRDADSHATYAEVTDQATGRRCDFLAVSLWASRGLCVDGHEVKVSRSDWLAEPARPTKADPWWPVCHRWWLVVPSAGLVAEGELPAGWGLMVPTGARRLRVLTPAVRREVSPPMWLLAALVRRDKLAVSAAGSQGREQGYRDGVAAERDRADRAVLSAEQSRKLAAFDELAALLGAEVDPYAWGTDGRITPARAASAVRIAAALDALDPRLGRGLADLVGLAGQVGAAGEQLRRAYDTVVAELVGTP